MWTPLRQEIEEIKKDLNISDDQFHEVSINAWKDIEENIYKHFCKISSYKNKPEWIWNCLKNETFALQFNRFPDSLIEELLEPEKEKKIWFFLNETVNEKTKFWFYEGNINAVLKIIGESAMIDEMYFASKNYDWLMCYNHHDILIVSGEKMISKIKNNGNYLKFYSVV